MEGLFIDFNKRDSIRRTFPLVAAFLIVSLLSRLLGSDSGAMTPAMMLEAALALVLLAAYLFPPKWYFKVDNSGIEYKRHLWRLRRLDWATVQRIELPPDRIAIELSDGQHADIALSFLLKKERLAIRGTITRYAVEKNLLSGT